MMVKQFPCLRPAGLWLALLLAAPVQAVEPGQAAPAFELPSSPGIVRLADYKGKTVYLDFWASWCVPCKQSFPWMNEMQARYRDAGLRVIGINVDQRPADASRFLAQLPAGFDLGFDPQGATPRQYAVKAMPTSVLIGPGGQVLAVHRGFSADDKPALERDIRKALGLAGDKP